MLINPATLPPESAVVDAGKDGMDLNAIKVIAFIINFSVQYFFRFISRFFLLRLLRRRLLLKAGIKKNKIKLRLHTNFHPHSTKSLLSATSTLPIQARALRFNHITFITFFFFFSKTLFVVIFNVCIQLQQQDQIKNIIDFSIRYF